MSVNSSKRASFCHQVAEIQLGKERGSEYRMSVRKKKKKEEWGRVKRVRERHGKMTGILGDDWKEREKEGGEEDS